MQHGSRRILQHTSAGHITDSSSTRGALSLQAMQIPICLLKNCRRLLPLRRYAVDLMRQLVPCICLCVALGQRCKQLSIAPGEHC